MSGWGGASGWFGGGTPYTESTPGLALSSTDSGQVSLVYAPPTDSTYASGEIDYSDGSSVWTVAATIVGTYTITGLTNGRAYYFTARAKSTTGGWSGPSVAVVATPNVPVVVKGITSDFEAYVILTLANALRETPALVDAYIQLFGARTPATDDLESWLALDVLTFRRSGSRSGVWKGEVMIQVSCFSRDPAERSDAQVPAAHRLAGVVARSLEQIHLPVMDYGNTPLQTLADIAVREPRMRSIPPAPGTNVWVVAVDFNAHITTG